MAWDVEFTDEFGAWWESLSVSRHGRMRELRVQHRGRPIRIFHAWDPRRVCVLLIGGDKTGDDRFYERMVAIADDLYDDHLDTLLEERDRGEASEESG